MGKELFSFLEIGLKFEDKKFGSLEFFDKDSQVAKEKKKTTGGFSLKNFFLGLFNKLLKLKTTFGFFTIFKFF